MVPLPLPWPGIMSTTQSSNDPQRPVIWLLSAYRADSHAAWADWLVGRFPEIDWQRLELPGRHFPWRIRGNPLSWLDALPGDRPDRILATSMVDLATLRGLHPRLGGVPTDYYFHENQFAYPLGAHQVRSVEPQMVQLYGALCADRLVFNSRFNRDSFLAGVDTLLGKMPDQVPVGVSARLAARAQICPVPILSPPLPEAGHQSDLIVWNHRWEYDKAPEVFADAMLRLAAEGVGFRLALLGGRHGRIHPALQRLRDQLSDRIVADGRLPAAEYRHWLAQAGIVVSTAIHEFQGLAMLEAVNAGAAPLVPDALCYPEQYPAAYRYPAGDIDALVERLAAWLRGSRPTTPDVSAWRESALHPSWKELLGGLVGRVVPE